MQPLIFSLAFAALASAAGLNTSQEYILKTELKPGQSGKDAFECLYLSHYHTGAGLSDVAFVTDEANGAKGFLNASLTTSDGTTYYNQEFDLESGYPWQLVMLQNVVFEAAWQPIRMNIGLGGGSGTAVSGFFINETGLQWNSNPNSTYNEFGGWIVCDWWHGVPQLFFRLAGWDTPAPCSCADVYLLPQYL